MKVFCNEQLMQYDDFFIYLLIDSILIIKLGIENENKTMKLKYQARVHLNFELLLETQPEWCFL